LVGPSVDDQKNRAVTETLSHQYLDGQLFEVSNALHALKLPEHRYDKLCPNALFSSFNTSVGSAVSAPCDLSPSLASIHAIIADAAEKAHDADYTAKVTHRTLRWKPYKRVERDWFALTKQAVSATDDLWEFPVSLDDLHAGRSKKAALDLITAYQAALMKIVSAARYAVFYERISNQTGSSVRDRDIWTFGVIKGTTKGNYDAYARNDIESQGLALGDALRSLKLPEYRYRQACPSFSLLVSVPVRPKSASPCALSGQFDTIRRTFAELNGTARDIGGTASRLHATSRWRPYKHIENEWFRFSDLADTMLNDVSDIPVAVDGSPDGVKKAAALDLASAYQSAVGHLFNYSRSALYFERTQNLISWDQARGYIHFGIYRMTVPALRNSIAQADFDGNAQEAGKATRMVRLPEYRYERLCGASLASN
jgi:hypothetical protein